MQGVFRCLRNFFFPEPLALRAKPSSTHGCRFTLEFAFDGDDLVQFEEDKNRLLEWTKDRTKIHVQVRES
jgi:hypothetical protein